MLSCFLLFLIAVVQAQQFPGLWEQYNVFDIEQHYNDDVGPGSRAYAQTWTDSHSNLWLYGGIGYSQSCTPQNLIVYEDMWVKNATGEWQLVLQGGIKIGPRAAALTWIYMDVLYLYGGEQTLTAYSNDTSEFLKPTQSGNLYQFTIGANAWASVWTGAVVNSPTEPGARLGAASFDNNAGLLYIFGGMTSDGDVRNDWWKFNLYNQSGGWGTPDPSFGTPSLNCLSGGGRPACVYGASSVSRNGVFYLAGGRTVSGPVSDVWNLTIAVGWVRTTPLSSSVYYASVLQPNTNVFYIFGGKTANTSYSGLQGYDTTNFSTTFQDQSWVFDGRYGAQVWRDKIYGGISLASGTSRICSDMLQFVGPDNWLKITTNTPWVQLPMSALARFQPGARTGAMTWVANSTGDLWLYGGLPAYTCTDGKILRDLWTFNAASRNWDLIDKNGPMDARGAATWTDDDGNMWMYGGDRSTTTTPDYACEMYAYFATGGWINSIGCPPAFVSRRFKPITWTYGGLLYMYGGISAADSSNLNDVNVFDPAVGARSWSSGGVLPLVPIVDTLSTVSWIAQDDIYIYTQNQTLYRWDKVVANGWQAVTQIGQNKPDVRQNAISWLDGAENLYLTKGGVDPADRTIWVYNKLTASWTFLNISDPPGALLHDQYNAPFWSGGWIYVWAYETGSSSLSMWLLDPCAYGAASCPGSKLCVHTAGPRCITTDNFKPSIQFTFSNTLADTKGQYFLTTLSPNFVDSGCGKAVNTLLSGGSTLPGGVWAGVSNDFSIGAKLKFNTTQDTVIILADVTCGLNWDLDYSVSNKKLSLTYHGITKSFSPIQINITDYFQVFITRSGAIFTVFINNAQILNGDFGAQDTITNGLSFGGCSGAGTIAIDDVAIYPYPSSVFAIYSPNCSAPANSTGTVITECGHTYSQPGYYYLSGSLADFTVSPCIVFKDTANIVFDGNDNLMSCTQANGGVCTAVLVSGVSSFVAQYLNLKYSGIFLENSANYSLSDILVQNADIGIATVASDGNVNCVLSGNTIGIKTQGGSVLRISGGRISGSAFGVVAENMNYVEIKTLVMTDIFPVPARYAQSAFIYINSSLNSSMVVDVEGVSMTTGSCIGSAINIYAISAQVSFNNNMMSSIQSYSDTEKFNVVYMHANILLTLDSADNVISDITVACNEFSFLGVESVEAHGTATIKRDKFGPVTPQVQNCSAANSKPFKGIWAANVDIKIGSVQMTNVSLPNLAGDSIQRVLVEDRYMAGVALYNQSGLKLDNSQFFNFTAPSILPCNCSFMTGYSTIAVVSAWQSNTATITDCTFESFRAGNAGIVPGYVPGLVQATGGNTAIFGVPYGTAAITLVNSTYNYFRTGDGELPFDAAVTANCTAGGDFLIMQQGITQQQLTPGADPIGTKQGTSCFSPCNPVCSTNSSQTCGFDGQCRCYPYYISHGFYCEVNSISDCSYFSGAGGFENGNIFSNGVLVQAPGECENNSLAVTSVYSPSALFSNITIDIGQAVNVSFWTRGFNLVTPAFMDVNFYDTMARSYASRFIFGPGTYGWNRQFLNYKPSFNVTNVNITISVPSSGGAIFDNFAIAGIITCNMSCGPNQICEMIEGVPTCVCFSGYKLNPLGSSVCMDINECLDSTLNATCNEHATCNNLPGSFNCTCNKGFEGDGVTCSPVCLCMPHGQCGALLGDHYNCTCDKGYVENNGECVDLNECLTPEIYCNLNISFCNNLIGNYTCGPCKAGSQGTIYNQCTDINECLVHNGGCDPHVVCINTDPWWTCPPCPPLFTGNSSTKCTPLCGDNFCDQSIGETCVSCPFDCTSATCSQCGDGKCDAFESCTSCFDDCSDQCVLKQCQVPDCSGHGTCHDGTCFCTDNWSGPDCKVNNVPVNVTTSSPDPVVTVSSPSQQTSFSISISNIQEVRPDSSIAEQFELQNFTKVTNQTAYSTIWFFTTTLDNEAFVNITVQFFNDTTTGNFANKTNTFAANTIKFNVNVKNWPFKAAQNSLAILMGAANDQQATRSCNIDSNTNTNGSLTWYTLSINGVTMYGQFSPDAILDGRNRIITFRLNPENGQVTAVVPHFWEEMDLDPTFSVLVGKGVDNCKKHSNVNKTVYIAVFVTVGVLIILGVAGYFLYPKLRTFFKVRKSGVELQLIPSTDDENKPVIEKIDNMEVYTHAGKYTVRM